MRMLIAVFSALLFLPVVVFAQSVSHPAGDVTSGTFSGDYAFDGFLTVGDVSAGLFYDSTAGKMVVASPDGSGAIDVFDDGVSVADNLTVNEGIEFSDGSFQQSAATGLWVEGSGDDIYYNDGNVGIGTSSPEAGLEVSDDGGGVPEVWIEGSGGGPVLRFVEGSTKRFAASYNLADNAFYLRNPAGPVLKVNDGESAARFQGDVLVPNGNVGIGTSSPGNVLDLNTGSTTSGIAFDGQEALTGYSGNGWLRLNQNNEFGNGVYTPGLLRADGGFRFSGNRELDDPGGNYGTVAVTGSGKNGWEGYSINNRFVWMSDDSSTVGLYDDSENNWQILFEDNSYTRIYGADGGGYIYFDNGPNLRMRDRNIYDANDVQANRIYDPEDGWLRVEDHLDMRNHVIRNLRDPSAGDDAATKNYVDNNAGADYSSMGATKDGGWFRPLADSYLGEINGVAMFDRAYDVFGIMSDMENEYDMHLSRETQSSTFRWKGYYETSTSSKSSNPDGSNYHLFGVGIAGGSNNINDGAFHKNEGARDYRGAVAAMVDSSGNVLVGNWVRGGDASLSDSGKDVSVTGGFPWEIIANIDGDDSTTWNVQLIVDGTTVFNGAPAEDSLGMPGVFGNSDGRWHVVDMVAKFESTI